MTHKQNMFKIVVFCPGYNTETFENLVFNCAKDRVGCIFSKKNIHEIYGFGKYSDYVRVYSAIKNNNFKIISSKGLDII